MKTCTKCEIEKDESQFRKPASKRCMQCEKETILTRILKYQNTDIGLENLDTTLENIITKTKYASSTYELPLDKAISLVKEGRAHVYKPDMIYRNDIDSKDSWIVKYLVFERDLNLCHYCGEKGDTVDHIVPESKGGKYIETNLVCCCSNCNSDKSDMDYEEYMKYILLPKWKRKPKTPDAIIKMKQEKSKKESRIPKVLLKQKDKYGW